MAFCPFISNGYDIVQCEGVDCMMYGNYLIERPIDEGIDLVMMTGCTVGRRVVE